MQLFINEIKKHLDIHMSNLSLIQKFTLIHIPLKIIFQNK
jgi:hypothetical protein